MMNIKKIILFHPFTARSVGLSQTDLALSHIRPIVRVVKGLAECNKWNFSVHYLSEDKFHSKEVVNGISINFWPISFRRLKRSYKYRKQWSIRALISFLISTPDITLINFSGFGSGFAQTLGWVAHIKKKPYIVMIGKNVGFNSRQLNFLKRASQIFVHTKRQEEALLNNPVFQRCKISYLPLGVDTNHFKPIDNNQKTNYPTLLFVGRVVPSKGVHLAISALKSLTEVFPNAHLNIIGSIPDQNYASELRRQIEDAQVQDHVSLLGSISYNELIPWYQQANLFILPSSSESFGMVIVESMACGTPVVALIGSGGPDDIVIHDYCGLLLTPENLGKEITILLQDSNKLYQMRNNSIERVLKNYSQNITYQILSDVIFGLLKP